MKKFILFLLWFPCNIILLIFCFSLLGQSQITTEKQANNIPLLLSKMQSQSQAIPNPVSWENQDIREMVLEQYLRKYNSPLADHARDLVATADRWGIDYTILPAIALQESAGCKRIPQDSFNCWGYGIYQDKVIRFSSYEEAMDQIAKTIKVSYINNGLTNPTLLEDKWAPPSRGIWSFAVNFFTSQIKELEKTISNT